MTDQILDDVTGLPLSATDEAAIKKNVIEHIPFTEFTEYISNVGDEPSAQIVPLDMSTYIDAATFEQISIGLVYMPRQKFSSWFDLNVAPVIDWNYRPLVKKSLLALFNKVNLAESNRRQISPWDWEQIKMRTLYQDIGDSQITDTMFDNVTGEQIFGVQNDDRKTSLMLRYSELPKIGDLGLEINRQNAIKVLLEQGEFDLVDKIITTFESVTPEETDLIENTPEIDVNALKAQANITDSQDSRQNAVVIDKESLQPIKASSTKYALSNPILKFFR